MENSLAIDVYNTIVKCLTDESLSYTPLKEAQQPVHALQGNTKDLSLFQYMADSDPEIRAQEALFPYLLALPARVEREHHSTIDGKRRQFDFLVTDENGNRVIVELKHYTPHQTGQFAGLLGPVAGPNRTYPTLHEDYYKPRPAGVPFIQVGLFTAVDEVSPETAQKDVDNTFVFNFVRKPKKPSEYEEASRHALDNWELRAQYRCPVEVASRDDFYIGRESVFFTSNNIRVSGRVNYFIGLVTGS